MKKYSKLIPILLCIAFATSACGKKPTAEVTNPIGDTKEKIYQNKLDVLRPMAYGNINNLNLEPGSYLSIIGRSKKNSYWDEVKAGAEQAVDDLNEMLGYEGADKIKLNYSAPKKTDDVNEQINILDEELARDPIAIGIAASDASACLTQFDSARESSIPIVMFDSGSEYKDVAATCSTDNTLAAITAANNLASSIDEIGEIVIFVQDSTSTTSQGREQFFLKTIKKKFPQIKVSGIYHFDELEQYKDKITAETKSEKENITQSDVIKWILEKHPNLKGIYTTNLDVTQEVAHTVKALNRTDLKIVGFDGGKEQLALLEDGTLEGLIVQNPFGMGYATVVAMARASLNMGNEAFIDSGYTWVTAANLEEDSILKMMY